MVNDITIAVTIITIFFATAVAIPLINDATDMQTDTFETDQLSSDVSDDAESISTLSAFQVLKTVLVLAVFDFGDTLGLPLWLDMVYTLLAITLTLTIARNIWIGGGA